MDDYIKRMANEQLELSEKMVALREFTHSETFSGLGCADQTLLIAQLSAMGSYKEILTLRLGRALSAVA